MQGVFFLDIDIRFLLLIYFYLSANLYYCSLTPPDRSAPVKASVCRRTKRGRHSLTSHTREHNRYICMRLSCAVSHRIGLLFFILNNNLSSHAHHQQLLACLLAAKYHGFGTAGAQG